MMKIVLIRPPRPISDTEFISLQFPLNLGYIASFLQQQGYNVEIWDYEVEGLTEQGLSRRVLEAKPNLIGITALTPTVISAEHIASLIKRVCPEILIVAGGAHPTALPIETLKEFANFDMVVVGEGEKTLGEILHYLEQKRPPVGIQGTAYRQQDGRIKVENSPPLLEELNVLPFPARDLVNQDLYQAHHVSRAFSRRFQKISEIMTIRGCPYNCIFCASHYRTVRSRNIENVLVEVEECIKKYQTSHFSFLDETITLNAQYISQLCRGLKRFAGISWDCFARVNTVSFEMLREMAASGCQKVSYGVESGSPRILNLLKKNITVGQVRDAFAWSKQAGIRYVEGSFMVGAHPTETEDDIEMSAKLIFEIEPDILMLAIMVPYPGTEIYKIMQEKGYLEQGIRWDDFTFFSYRPAWRTDYLSASQLVEIHRKLLRRFYLRPKYILKILSKIRRYNELLYWLSEGIDFITKINRKEPMRCGIIKRYR